MNIDQWINQIIESPERQAIPIMTHPGIELINEKVINAVNDGDIHYKAIQALEHYFPASAACTVIMDLTVEAEAFGADIQFSESEVPNVVGMLIDNYDDIQKLQIPSIASARIPQYLKANKLSSSHIKKPILGGCIGPFSLAGRLMGMTEAFMAIYTAPESISLLLNKCTQFITAYCLAIKKNGSAGVIIAEPAAGLLSNEDCLTYSSKYVRRIVDEIQDENFLVVLHNCGNMGQCTQAMVATGAKGYHFGNKIDMVEAIKGCPSDVLVMGNLDPVGVLQQSTEREVYHETFALLQKLKEYPNFVLSTGCDVPPDVPIRNVEAFYAAIKDYNQNRK